MEFYTEKQEQDLIKGKGVEDTFFDEFDEGERLRKSNKIEDRLHHIDGFLLLNGIPYGVDVKQMKRIRSTDAFPCKDYVWLELMNGDGYDGWLFGKADLIAFQWVGCWILVEREKLLDFVYKNFDINKIVYNQYVADGCCFRRYNRLDKVCPVFIQYIIDMAFLIKPLRENIGKELLLKVAFKTLKEVEIENINLNEEQKKKDQIKINEIYENSKLLKMENKGGHGLGA